ncbi:MAG: metallophosphoesterase [Parvularculaceae bacterium]|nr:metallophosphoesterase [Parvularculaceae bacterium]
MSESESDFSVSKTSVCEGVAFPRTNESAATDVETRALKVIEINDRGRDFVVGDLHGCIAEFDRLLRRIGFDFQKDRMFSVGDLVDRGPESMECLRLLRESWFFAVKGNHEDMMLQAIECNLRAGAELWINNGGDWGIERFEDGDPEFFALAEVLDALPYALTVHSRDIGLVGITHAEPPTKWDERCVEDEVDRLTWSRRMISARGRGRVSDGADFSAHGHTIVDQVTYKEDLKAFWIDLGCFATGRLCALQIAGHDAAMPRPIIVQS